MMYGLYALVALVSSVGPSQQPVHLTPVRIYVESDAENVAAAAAIPRNVSVADTYEATLRTMLERSGTFRQQCRRIGRARGLVVRLRRGFPHERARNEAAYTTVIRRAGGDLEATVLLGDGDPVELIAHEFEHILEQLDDVDLAAMGSRPGTGVSLNTAMGRFETVRAIAAGRRVGVEVARARR